MILSMIFNLRDGLEASIIRNSFIQGDTDGQVM